MKRKNIFQKSIQNLIKKENKKMDDENYLKIQAALEEKYGKKKADKIINDFYDQAFKKGREDGQNFEKKSLYLKLKNLSNELSDSILISDLKLNKNIKVNPKN